MVDRDTLIKVAQGYHDLIALQTKQKETMALMLRVCVSRLRSPDACKRKEAIDGLEQLIDMLISRDKTDG